MRAGSNLVRAIAACTCVLLPALARAEVRYRVQRFIDPTPDCFCFVWPEALNDAGQVTGHIEFYDEETVIPFVTAEGAAAVDLLEQLASYGIAHGADVNQSGDFVGFAITIDSAATAYLLHHADGLRLLDGLPPGAQFQDVWASNDSNQVVGTFRQGNAIHAFRWDAINGVVDLGDLPGGEDRSEAYAINNAGVIVGIVDTGRGFSQREAFMWDEEDGMRILGEPPGGLALDAVFIGDNGLVAGTADIGGQPPQPYVWTQQSGFTLLGYMPGSPGPAYGLGGNSRGQVVGWGHNASRFQRPFVADAQSGVRELQPLLDPCVADQHPYMHFAHDINDAGMIIVSDFTDGSALLLTPYLPGDLNENGAVDLQDLASMLANFSRSGDATYTDGDTDCDADVDLEDLAALLANFGAALP